MKFGVGGYLNEGFSRRLFANGVAELQVVHSHLIAEGEGGTVTQSHRFYDKDI